MELVKFNQAYNAIMEAKTVDEVKQIRDKAEALRLYLKQQGESLEMQNACAEIKIRAERRAGELLKEMPKNGGTRGQLNGRDSSGGNIVLPPENEPTLSDIGLTKMQSSRFQSIADIPEMIFEQTIAQTKDNKGELTTNQLLKLSKDLKRIGQQEQAREQVITLSESNITLHNTDSIVFVPTLTDSSIPLVITDPPYNTTEHAWDNVGSDEDFILFTQKWLNTIRPKLAPNYHLFFFCDPDYIAPIEMLLRRDRWPLKSRIIWEYRNLVKGRDVADKFIENWQMCFHIGTHALNWSLDWDDRRFMVQNHATPQSNFSEGKYHPTQKPLSLIKLFIEVGSKIGDLVLDPFAGSGTTGIACQELGRDCILIERDSGYCDVIEQRLGVKKI